MKTTPNGNRYWLKEHQITAFWHGFGISNGLNVPLENVKKVTYSRGTPRQIYRVDAEFMRKCLDNYIGWLKSYADSWNRDGKHPYDTATRKAFLKGEAQHSSRAGILEMVELLQKCRIDEKI